MPSELKPSRSFQDMHANSFSRIASSPRPSLSLLDFRGSEPQFPVPRGSFPSYQTLHKPLLPTHSQRPRSSLATVPEPKPTNRNLIVWIGVFSLVCLCALAIASNLQWFKDTFVHKREATLATKHCPEKRTSCFLPVVLKNSTINETVGVPPTAWEAVDLSKRSIHAIIAGLESEEIYTSLVSALNRNVKIKVVLAKVPTHPKDGQVASLVGYGAEVKVWPAAMEHHKFGVYDSRLLVAGPGRWMNHPLSHPHELVLLSQDRGLVQDLEEYFLDVWEKAGSLYKPDADEALSGSHEEERAMTL